MSDLGDLFKVLSDAKKEQKAIEENTPAARALKGVQERLRQNNDVVEMMEVFVEKKPRVVELIKEVEVIREVVVEPEKPTFQQPAPQPIDQNMEAIKRKLQFLEQAIGKIAATGPGSGEVNLRYLDDIDRSSIYDMRFLRYNNTKKKFEFAEVNPHDIVYETMLVDTSSYTIDDNDYYVGVDYAGPTTITLPPMPSSGRVLIIKDESGLAATNPITVVGTVDNDTGGFIIQINNGGVQLIYRNGWRIV